MNPGLSGAEGLGWRWLSGGMSRDAGFAFDFDARQATCPQEAASSSWNPCRQHHDEAIVVSWPSDRVRPLPGTPAVHQRQAPPDHHPLPRTARSTRQRPRRADLGTVESPRNPAARCGWPATPSRLRRFPGMAMPLTGHRASPTAVTLTAPSGPGWRHRRRDRPERRACAALRDTRAVPGPAARRVGDPVQARECATTQGSEVEDRSGAPAELAARFSAATRTQPHESSRSAGAIRQCQRLYVNQRVRFSRFWLRCVIFPGWQRVVLVSCGQSEAPARRGIA